MDNIFSGDTENVTICVEKDTTKEELELVQMMYPKAKIIKEGDDKLKWITFWNIYWHITLIRK